MPNTHHTSYEILLQGEIDPCWFDWFDQLTFTRLPGGVTRLSGSLPDQAALHGLLALIRDLNLTLLSVRQAPDQRNTEIHTDEPPEA